MSDVYATCLLSQPSTRTRPQSSSRVWKPLFIVYEPPVGVALVEQTQSFSLSHRSARHATIIYGYRDSNTANINMAVNPLSQTEAIGDTRVVGLRGKGAAALSV